MIEIGFSFLIQMTLAALFWRLFWSHLPPIARRTALALFACQITLFLLYAHSRFTVGVPRYSKWLFNLKHGG